MRLQFYYRPGVHIRSERAKKLAECARNAVDRFFGYCEAWK
jgi:hypothetical protein